MRKTEITFIPKRVLLALFSICAVFIIVRQIPLQTTLVWGIDKIAHFLVSWLLAIIFLWISRIRYQINGSKAKKTTFLWVLFLGILWEIAELFDLKQGGAPAFSGTQNEWLHYGIDTGLDLMFDACGTIWYLYSSEMFLVSSDSDPVP